MLSLLWLFASLQTESLLYQADLVAKSFQTEIAKLDAPKDAPQTDACIDCASVWFCVDLDHTVSLANEEVWAFIREIGADGVYFKNLKAHSQNWNEISVAVQKRNLAPIVDGLGNSTKIGADFMLALQNVGDYPDLYHLIETEDKLPEGELSWLTKNELHLSDGN